MTVADLIAKLEAMPAYREIGISDCMSNDHDCDGFCDLMTILDVRDTGFAVELDVER